jgi:hypothetical protein
MTKSRPIKKSTVKGPGVKALITATSLAVTLGGWAAFTRAQADATDTASPDPAIALMPVRPSTDLALAAPLLPTLVPQPQTPPRLAIDHPPAIPAALLNARPPTVRQVVARQPAPAAAEPQAAPAAAEPAPAPPPLPAVSAPPLRVVSAPPPAHVAKTRSSR